MRSLFALQRGYATNNLRFYSNVKVKVHVRQGIVVGTHAKLPNGVEYESFLGVPYAEPPVGELRFRSPVLLERFKEHELDCSKEGDVSHQRDPLKQQVIGSENCLFLNIYAPKSNSQKPLPVMVWIHGGGFWFGSGNRDYHFPAQLMQEEVIVVTLNYRLGALGFLSLPEAGIYGNAGLKDQRLALQWVQDNIANFNGDPQNVTLFGESAGASSVHMHMYGPHANKLFHKAIMQSGTGNSEWVLQENGPFKARRLGELLQGKNIETDYKLLEFLQSEEATPLAMLAKTLDVLTDDERRRHLPFSFKPVVEDPRSPDSILNKPFLDLLHDKERLPEIPVLLGYNSAEGTVLITNPKQKVELFDKDMVRLVPRNLVEDPEAPEALEAAEDIRQFYFNGKSPTIECFDNLVDLLGDVHFNLDLQHTAEVHASFQKVPFYFYRFDYVGGRNMYKKAFLADKLRGASHADELSYLFQWFNDNSLLTADDAQISKRMGHMWANFAKYGKPADSWTPVQKQKRDANGTLEPYQLDYMQLDRECKMQRNPDGERMDFWRYMYKKYKPQCYEALMAKM
ncbi:acetylcholinesterase-like [Drosophila hydei]|uniref:carboxylesterase n=1 Tax=Drosophila hydei TaxID=7224 RepID=A0A6J1L9L0_DROHY|nr:acetylcholinesterase-like [Drosophila hydei]